MKSPRTKKFDLLSLFSPGFLCFLAPEEGRKTAISGSTDFFGQFVCTVQRTLYEKHGEVSNEASPENATGKNEQGIGHGPEL